MATLIQFQSVRVYLKNGDTPKSWQFLGIYAANILITTMTLGSIQATLCGYTGDVNGYGVVVDRQPI